MVCSNKEALIFQGKISRSLRLKKKSRPHGGDVIANERSNHLLRGKESVGRGVALLYDVECE